MAAGTALPLTGREVRGEVARCQRAECDERRGILDLLPRGRPQTQPRDDRVRLARQLLEHPLRLAHVGRLSVDAPAENDRRVDAEHGPAVRLRLHRLRLAARMRAYQLGRVRLT